MRILIIHTAFIGDIVLSTPLIRKIKDTYPESEIYFLTTPAGAGVLKNNPDIKEIISYDKHGVHKGINGVIDLGKRLRHMNFGMVLSLHRYMRSSILAWLSRSPVRKCYDNAVGAFLFTEKIKYNTGKHEVEKILSFLPENMKKSDRDYAIELYPSEKDSEKVQELLKEKSNKQIVTVAPGSRWFTKKWPLEYYNTLIEKISMRGDTTVVIVGGLDETLLNVKSTENTIDLRGKTSLLEMAEVLRRSVAVVTNDSSPVHMGSAWKDTRVFAIFGPTVEKFGFFPWSKNSKVFEVSNLSCRPCGIHGGNKCPKRHFKCMLDIKPEAVYKELGEYLDREVGKVEENQR